MEERSFQLELSLTCLPQSIGRIAERPRVCGDGYRSQRGDKRAEIVEEPDEAVEEEANENDNEEDKDDVGYSAEDIVGHWALHFACT